jgi:hypothetical protein
LTLAAAVAAGSAAVVSFVPVAVVTTLLRLAEGDGPAVAGAVRVAAAGWLLGHGVPLQVGAGSIGLLPLALTALAAWRVSRAGVHVSRAIGARGTRSWRKAATAAVAVAAAYGVIGLFVAAFAAGRGWWVEPVRAAGTLAAFGFVAAAYGSLRTTGLLAALSARLPMVVRGGARTGLVAALLVLAAGAATVGVSVALRAGDAADTVAVYGTGVAGQAGLTLVCLAYAPNLAVWAAAYLAGPGFAVGAGTIVRSSEVVAGPLPAVPVLAGLPEGPLPAVGATLLAVPTVAGLIAGWLLARRARPPGPPPSWPGLLGGALLAGPAAAVLMAGAATVSGGPLGVGHLASTGPVAWQVAVLTAALVTPGTLLGAALAGITSRR